MDKKIKPTKEKVIKNIIAILKEDECFSFRLEDLERLLENGEKLKGLGNDLFKLDNKNTSGRNSKRHS